MKLVLHAEVGFASSSVSVSSVDGDRRGRSKTVDLASSPLQSKKDPSGDIISGTRIPSHHLYVVL